MVLFLEILARYRSDVFGCGGGGTTIHYMVLYNGKRIMRMAGLLSNSDLGVFGLLELIRW